MIKPSVAEPGKGILRIKGAKGKKEIVDGVKSVNSKVYTFENIKSEQI